MCGQGALGGNGVRVAAGCEWEKVLALIDYILGVYWDAKRSGDWEALERTLLAVRERLYYYTIDEIKAELGL